MDLQEGGDVDLREVEGDEHLDDELVPRRRRHVRRCAEPGLELLGPRRGQREGALRAGAVVVGVDEAVALEPLQGRVDLPDVERPHLAGAVLELLAELQPVLRSLAEQGQEGVADAHRRSPFISSIPSIIRHDHLGSSGTGGVTTTPSPANSSATSCWCAATPGAALDLLDAHQGLEAERDVVGGIPPARRGDARLDQGSPGLRIAGPAAGVAVEAVDEVDDAHHRYVLGPPPQVLDHRQRRLVIALEHEPLHDPGLGLDAAGPRRRCPPAPRRPRRAARGLR